MKLPNAKEISIPKKQLVKMMRSIEKVDDESPISFEFILVALFPNVWKNIQATIQEAYNIGFKEGFSQGELYADKEPS